MAEANEYIHVLYALSDKRGTYAKFLGTSMLSAMEHTKSKLVFHIFHDGSLKGKNLRMLQRMVRDYGQELQHYNVRNLQADLFRQAEEIFREGMQDGRYT